MMLVVVMACSPPPLSWLLCATPSNLLEDAYISLFIVTVIEEVATSAGESASTTVAWKALWAFWAFKSDRKRVMFTPVKSCMTVNEI
jgi:hypothetical protein